MTAFAVLSSRRRRTAAMGALRSLRGWAPVAALVVLWQFFGDGESIAFPRPSSWLEGLSRLHESGALLPSVWTTLYTFLVSLLAACILGTAVGYALGANARLERAVSPLTDFFRTLPPPAIVPVALLLLGPTLRASVTIVVVAIIWPILLNVAAAARTIPSVRLDMARSLGLSRSQRLLSVVLPSLAPGIVLGLRIAVSISLVVTLLVDIMGHGAGLGRLLLVRQTRFDTEAVWGILAVIGVFGYIFGAAINTLERRLPWCTKSG